MANDANNNPLNLKKDRVLNSITIALVALGLLCVGYVLVSNLMKRKQVRDLGNLDCVKNTATLVVGDEHMAGVLEKGTSVKVLENFYNCNEVKTGDLVLYKFSEQIEPVVRIVRGLPGDRYKLTQDEAKKGRWSISINDKALTVGTEPYFIESNTVPPLKTYEISRGGVLQLDEYILLSNKPPGLSDSSNLGLISKKALSGKVLK